MARRKKHEEHENHERWLVSYADFITLLFAFFVVLYATSNRNEQKEKEFQESIRHAMKILGVGLGVSGQGQSQAGAVFDSLDTIKKPSAANNDMKSELVKIIQSKMTETELKKYVNDVRADAHGVRLILAADSLFGAATAKLQGPALHILGSVADVYKTTPYKVVVEAHTDNQDFVSDRFESHWEFAAARASTIIRYFAKVHGVDAHKMSAVSFADQRPMYSNDDPNLRAKNNRIEIFLDTTQDAEE